MPRQFESAGAFVAGLAGLAAAALLPACGGERGVATSSRRPPLVVVAVDGLDWDVLLPLARAGELPHLAALMERGSWGELATIRPTWSPVIWTTIATGKPPHEHGIEGFTVREDDVERLVRSDDRRVKALWDIADDHGKRSAVVGWWASWPAESFAGACVTQRGELGLDLAKGGLFPELPGQCAPASLEPLVRAKAAESARELPELRQALFGAHDLLGPLEARLFEHCLWSVRADDTYARIAEELLRGEPAFDLVAVYLGSPDVIGHRAWRYREPEAFAHPPDDAAVARVGPWLDRDVRWVDRWIGRLCAAAGPEANVVVLSDHGMHAANRSARFDPEAPIEALCSGHHEDAPPGVLVAAGPDVARSGLPLDAEPPPLAEVWDVLPTLLAWLDVPAGADMRGAPARALFPLEHLRAFPPRRVPTHEDEAWERRREERRRAARALEEALPDRARLRQLSDLGYLGEQR